MIDPGHPRLSIVRQCELVSIGRSTFYREATPESAENLVLMRLIDEQFLETPRYGSRQMARHLRRNAHGQDGLGADLSAAEDQRTASASQDLSLLSAALGDRPEPSLVRRHHLHPDAARLPRPSRIHGLGEPQGPVRRLSNTMDRSSALPRWRKPSLGTAGLTSSTPIVKGSRLVSGRPDSNTDRPQRFCDSVARRSWQLSAALRPTTSAAIEPRTARLSLCNFEQSRRKTRAEMARRSCEPTEQRNGKARVRVKARLGACGGGHRVGYRDK
jgi:hypothetical protein